MDITENYFIDGIDRLLLTRIRKEGKEVLEKTPYIWFIEVLKCFQFYRFNFYHCFRDRSALEIKCDFDWEKFKASNGC